MTELYLTPTRREFLEAVHAGNVVDGPDDKGVIHTWLINPPYEPRKVNARADEAVLGGWVLYLNRRWVLTAAGFRILGWTKEPAKTGGAP